MNRENVADRGRRGGQGGSPAIRRPPARGVRYNRGVTKKELRDRALELPPEERARLAHEIISSLDGPSDDDASAAWVSEIERRVREVRDGAVRLVDWKDARARILKRLASKR